MRQIYYICRKNDAFLILDNLKVLGTQVLWPPRGLDDYIS